jgi:eukaryotic-like serine/threonine-protein kinase
MSSKVTLKVTQGGELTGKKFSFSDPTTCSVGRADNCALRMPDSWPYRNISRHHCLLVINPPEVQVMDFGSKNGTYVNGEIIGQRDWKTEGEESRELHSGDEIRVGDVVLQVDVES